MTRDEQIKHLKDLALFEADPNAALLSKLAEIATVFGRIQGFKGDKGDMPEKGVDYFTPEEIDKIKKEILADATPTKYKDYFTQEEIDQFLAAVTPIKGVHYRDGIDGKDGVGIPGRDGKDGVGKPGKDGRDGKDAQPLDVMDVIEAIKKLKGKQADEFAKAIGSKIDISYIRNAQSFIFNGKKYGIHELMRGAGGSGSSSTTTKETFTTTGGSQTVTVAHTPTAILLVVLNGQVLELTDDYTVSGASITLTNTQIPSGLKISVVYTY